MNLDDSQNIATPTPMASSSIGSVIVCHVQWPVSLVRGFVSNNPTCYFDIYALLGHSNECVSHYAIGRTLKL